MKISYQWLKNYVDLDKTPEEIEEALTLIGFEVEDIEEKGCPQLNKVCVGEVLERNQHPDADKLSVCQVKVDADETKQIVCGADNYKVGDRVIVALPGAKLPGNFKIKKSKLRGVPSEGMMCGANEVGLPGDDKGLMILEDRPDVGTPINDVFTDTDTVFDIEITPNRPDCLSHIGIAREMAAYFDLKLKEPEVSERSAVGGDNLISSVEVETETCPLYYAWSIKGVKIGPSPDWLKRDLEAVGLRPINNVVDITNYVLLETGQPLHAFDSAKIKGGKIIVRQATEGEKVTTLDDKERELTDRMAVIADAERGLVVAGVMGSVDAEVDDSTVDIVLEAAYFNPSDIRWASRRLALSTDSSYRFERGIDPHRTDIAARRAIDLILDLAGGELVGDRIQVGGLPEHPENVMVKPDFIRDYCGFGPDNDAMKKILERLELGVDDSSDEWSLTIPTFRRDLERPVDIVEEFLRIYGTDKIPESTVSCVGMNRSDAGLSAFNGLASDFLKSRQFSECCHYSLRDSDELEKWYGDELLKNLALTNPLASDQSHLRPSLIPGLLDALKLNLHNGNDVRQLFECGRVFRVNASEEGNLWELASVSFVILQEPQKRLWKEGEKPDLFTVKSLANQILELTGLKIKNHIYELLTGSAVWQEQHAACSGDFSKEGYEVNLGIINLGMLKAWDINEPVLAGEILIKPDFFEKERKRKKFKSYSQFPGSAKDLALVVDKWVPAESVRGELEGAAKTAAGKEFDLESVEIFDVYAGKGLPEGKKSLAFSMSFRSPDKTLTDDAVNKVFDDIQKAITEDGKYSIR